MIDWMAFITVFAASLLSALVAVLLFSLALRLGAGEQRWHKFASVALFVVVALVVLYGIYIIVGDHLGQLFGLDS